MQTTRFRFVEVLVDNTTQQQFFFLTEPVLQDAAHIVGIEAYSVSDVPKSPNTKKALVADPIFAQSFLTIVDRKNDNEVISMMPLVNLNRRANNGMLATFNIDAPYVTKCYIKVADNSALVANTIFLLGFHYVARADIRNIHSATKL